MKKNKKHPRLYSLVKIISGLVLFAFSSNAMPAKDTMGFCFLEADIRLPSSEVSARVNVLEYKDQNQGYYFDLDLLKAVVTHESGGDIQAVSPTGCAGIGAICHKPFQRCCEMDEGESEKYQMCDQERISGFLCNKETDPRFDDQFSLQYMNDYFYEIAAWAGVTKPDLITMGYNAGPGFLNKLLEKTGRTVSREELLKNIRLEELGYPRSTAKYRAIKMIEIHDYVMWMDTLLVYWRSINQPSLLSSLRLTIENISLQMPRKYICYKYKYDVWSIGRFNSPDDAEICDQPEVLKVSNRLEFGRYTEGTINWCGS